MNRLFDKSLHAAPPIQGEAAAFGRLPISQGIRKGETLLGGREKARGFLDTFPLEARIQLRELEKGGRYTAQDVDQVLRGGTPSDDESLDRREAKRSALNENFDGETALYLQELKSLGGTWSPAVADEADPYIAEARRRGLMKE